MNNSTTHGCGIVYIAFGEQWAVETRRSIASLRKVSSLPVAVVTDRQWSIEPQPDFFVKRDYISGFAVKPKYLLDATPFENTLFVDTDTIIVQNPEPVFGLLKHYDIGVRFGGPQFNEEPNLIFHTQCNSGVILFKKCEALNEVFKLWNEEYDRACAVFPNQQDTRGLGDQRYLAIAIAKSNARPVHLAEYLNFALFETISTYSPLVVVHGRLNDMEVIAREINEKWDTSRDWKIRVWLPNARGILSSGIRNSDPLLAIALIFRRIWNDVRRRIF